MIDNIIQSVTEKLSSLPYIEGIILGGSRARGTHTEDSDIDIGIYYKSESFDITAINQIATELDDENRNNLVVPPGASIIQKIMERASLNLENGIPEKIFL